MPHWGLAEVGETGEASQLLGAWESSLGSVSPARQSSLTHFVPLGVFSPESSYEAGYNSNNITHLEKFLSVGNQHVLCPENRVRGHPNSSFLTNRNWMTGVLGAAWDPWTLISAPGGFSTESHHQFSRNAPLTHPQP